MDDLRGRLDFSFLMSDSRLCIGGNVVDLSGGECAIMEGSNSRGLDSGKECIGCEFMWLWRGGSSTEG